MDIGEHKKEFEKIVKKYGLFSDKKAQEITTLLTNQKITAKDFANKYKMSEEEAQIFLSFIQKGIEFKEKHIDKK